MRYVKNSSPEPRSHIKTLMRIGYDLNSAIADIIDNSITAKAKNIKIKCPSESEEPYLSILDDGHGMSSAELLQNMKIGCKDPNEKREAGDLGRFGSGMKTASFSHARRLTVITKKKGKKIAAACWDIDEIEEKNAWCLMELDDKDIKNLDFFDDSLLKSQGTQLIWEKIKKFESSDHVDGKRMIESSMVDLKKYLELHFHKFMQGPQKINFYVQDLKLKPFDPFLSSKKGYQEGSFEENSITGGKLKIQVHILPHHSNLTRAEIDEVGGMEEIYKGQGLYIYRENRLIIAGGWMGLSRTYQLGKLARIEINIPSGVDDDWSTDVKKSSLQLPQKIKNRLKKLIQEPIKRSKRTYTYRGKKEEANEYWKIIHDKRENTIVYQIDTDNSKLIEIAKETPKKNILDLKEYLKNLAKNLPINHIHSKVSSDPKSIKQDDVKFEFTEEQLEALNKLWST
ncbi:MAG: hypothetical protein CMD50_01025 [Gammaproteobacteria bacterium]|nr:hypothetical protein [Gammaproteobacteria bacterium]